MKEISTLAHLFLSIRTLHNRDDSSNVSFLNKFFYLVLNKLTAKVTSIFNAYC